MMCAVVFLAAFALLLAPRAAPGADAERGRALYESSCASCHTQSVHGRAKRVAKDFGAVREWVSRWNHDLAIGWSAEEIDDVAVHLNMRYYRYPCPPRICKVVSLAQ